MIDKLPEQSISQFTGRLSPALISILLRYRQRCSQMRDQGFQLVCVDGSPKMVKAVNTSFRLATTAFFSDLDATAHYDGIWANFSLLHAARKIFNILKTIHTALKIGGVLYLAEK